MNSKRKETYLPIQKERKASLLSRHWFIKHNTILATKNI